MTRIADLLKDASARLRTGGVENPRAEARLLMAHAAGLTPTQVFARDDQELPAAIHGVFDQVVARRVAGAPLAHIVGIREFWSLPFRVTPATLIPRPDSETVVALALELGFDQRGPGTVVDVGTGSGCLLLALLGEWSESRGIGIDVSAPALDVARENAIALGLAARTRFVQGAWLAGLAGPLDLIVSNPPYIPSADIPTLSRDVRDHEPALALDGGVDGLDAYRALLPMAAAVLTDGGAVVVEVGAGQAKAVGGIAAMAGLDPGPVGRDLRGIERALCFFKKGIGIAGPRG